MVISEFIPVVSGVVWGQAGPYIFPTLAFLRACTIALLCNYWAGARDEAIMTMKYYIELFRLLVSMWRWIVTLTYVNVPTEKRSALSQKYCGFDSGFSVNEVAAQFEGAETSHGWSLEVSR